MCRALEEEAKEVSARGGSRGVTVRNGRLQGEDGGRYLYSFSLADDVYLRDDALVRLSVPGRQDVSGAVASIRDGALLVALDTHLGPIVDSARLGTDEGFLLTSLAGRLGEIGLGDAGPFHLELARRTLAPGSTVRVGRTDPALPPGKLNAEQMDAVAQALGSEITYLWGPPGTGKTTVVARIVEEHYRAGRSVLLVSNTNAAVDTALERVCDRLTGDDGMAAGAVIRHGPIVKRELADTWGEQIDFERLLKKLGATLEEDRATALEEAGEASARAAAARQVLAAHVRVDDARSQLGTAQRAVEVARAGVQRTRAELAAAGGRAGELSRVHDRAAGMGSLRRTVARLDRPERYTLQLHTLRGEIARMQAEHTQLASALVGMQGAVETAALRVQAEEDAARDLPPRDVASRDVAQLDGQERAARERVHAAEEALKRLRQEVADRCRIFATTAARAYLPGTPRRTFDVVVIDEASMLLLPMAFYAAGLADHSVVVAGDFRQLPPIVVNTKSELVATWLQPNIFVRSGIAERVRRGQRPAHLAQLRRQYRMRAPICDLVNELTYADAPLITERSNEPQPVLPDLIGSSAVWLLDTSSIEPWATFPVGNSSRYNLAHASVVRALARHLSVSGYMSAAGPDALAVISPYAAQSKLHASVLTGMGFDGPALASTVHRFQGNEKGVVIVDLTEAKGIGKPSRMLRGAEAGPLLNVAASRARDCLIVLADMRFLRSKTEPGTPLAALLGYLDQRVPALPVQTVLDGEATGWPAAPWQHAVAALDTAAPAMAYEESAFMQAFPRDVADARESVVIFSPFCTERGTSRWIEAFRLAMARGVRIRIVTCPATGSASSTQAGLEDRLAQLRGLGCQVDERRNMHEKVAIIDGKVLWHGSLNILSHRSTTESMLRFLSEPACQELARLLITKAAGRREDPDLATAENPACAGCGAETVWESNRNGVLYRCRGCGAVIDSYDTAPVELKGSGEACPNPACDGILVPRKGWGGRPFLGCSNYGKTRCQGPRWAKA